MKAALVLARHSLKRQRAIVAGLCLILAAFQFLLTQVAVFLTRNQAFDMLSSLVPDFMRSVAGPSIVTFMSFTGVVSLGYFHPIVLAALLGLAIAMATEPASEIETHFADLTLARPVSRIAVIARSVVVLIAGVTLVLGMMTAATAIGLACCTPPTAPAIEPAVIRSLALNLGLIAWCWGGIAIAVAASARRRSAAAGISGVAALAAFLLDYLGRVWDPARAASRLSPFHYFDPMTVMSSGVLNGPNVAVLLGIGLAGTIAGFVIFARRDL